LTWKTFIYLCMYTEKVIWRSKNSSLFFFFCIFFCFFSDICHFFHLNALNHMKLSFNLRDIWGILFSYLYLNSCQIALKNSYRERTYHYRLSQRGIFSEIRIVSLRDPCWSFVGVFYEIFFGFWQSMHQNKATCRGNMNWWLYFGEHNFFTSFDVVEDLISEKIPALIYFSNVQLFYDHLTHKSFDILIEYATTKWYH